MRLPLYYLYLVIILTILSLAFLLTGCVECHFTTRFETPIINKMDQAVTVDFTWQFDKIYEYSVELAPRESKMVLLREVRMTPRSNKITTKRLPGNCPTDQTQVVGVSFSLLPEKPYQVCMDGEGNAVIYPKGQGC